MKKAYVYFSVLAISAALCVSCNDSKKGSETENSPETTEKTGEKAIEEQLLGKWKIDDVHVKAGEEWKSFSKDMPEQFKEIQSDYFEFQNGNVFKTVTQGKESSSEWKIEGKQLILKDTSKTVTCTYLLNADKLTLELNLEGIESKQMLSRIK